MPIRFLLLLATYLLLATLPSTAQPPKIALLIHLNRYRHWESLPTEKGLPLIQASLARQEFRQSAPPLVNEQATARAIRASFHTLINDPQTGVKGKKGAIVVVVLDGHGAQVADQNNDEAQSSLLPLDQYDETFVAFDAPKAVGELLPKAANTRHPDGYLLDDELGMYYDSIRREIGPTGHLLVLMPGCHTFSGNRGQEGHLEPLFTTADLAGMFTPAQLGKFVYFASVGRDADIVKPNAERRASPLLYAVAMALNQLTRRSTYLNLYHLVRAIVEQELTEADRAMAGLNPTFSPDSNPHELVFAGYVTPAATSRADAPQPASQSKAGPTLMTQFWQWSGTRSADANVPDPSWWVVAGGRLAGQQPGRVVELTDAAGRSLGLAAVLAANDTAALIRPDQPMANPAALRVRAPTLTLWLYADPAIDPVLRDSLRHWVGLTNVPAEASLRLSVVGGTYRLCATGLPYSADGCGERLAPADVLPKIRSLALYQVLRQYERRYVPATVTYRQARWVRGWAYAPADSARRDRWRRLQFRQNERPGESRYDSLTTLNETYRRDGFPVVDTDQSSLLVDIRTPRNWHHTYLDILPDQPVEGSALKASSAVGRLLMVQRGSQIIWFLPPYGLEENAFVFSPKPLNIEGVLNGQVPLTEAFINQIGYVVFDYHYILPDRRSYRH